MKLFRYFRHKKHGEPLPIDESTIKPTSPAETLSVGDIDRVQASLDLIDDAEI
jgi:hypothetical protein